MRQRVKRRAPGRTSLPESLGPALGHLDSSAAGSTVAQNQPSGDAAR